jgi:hypothetical protein
MDSFREFGMENSGRSDVLDGDVHAEDLGTAEKLLVQRALREILLSTPFRTSKQCQKLLRYVIHHSLAQHDNLLRERVIGTEVFDREPDYDTANDPIVRARMAEVRKRLAQYYIAEDHGTAAIRIAIPSGSYRAQFDLHSEAGLEAPAQPLLTADSDEHENSFLIPLPLAHPIAPTAGTVPHRSFRLWWWLIPGILVLGCGLLLALHPLYSSQERALRDFWSPGMESPMPILIYTGTNVVYRFSPQFLDKYRAAHHLDHTGPEFVVDLQTMQNLDPHDLVVSSNSYVTVGDISACASIVSMLARRNKPYQLRYAGDMSSGDLRSESTVLIGAFNNNWTLNVTAPLRFAFVGGDTIVDRQDKTRSWSVHVNPDGTTTDDYAVVTRLLSPKEGRILLTAAGIGQYGTQAASEFLSNPQRIADFAAKAPRDWSKKNIQIVLHIKVADETPAAVEIVAVHSW